ncbi:hypothetical protein MRS44_005310 [Fusarium solani]|uniref:uncharacterized protein n=1 Tax=Fusarium solani TaxID=169388 RepID=UPI0032C48945|nr:hypothetical protein MRS44_005310 [Fusarium solani]
MSSPNQPRYATQPKYPSKVLVRGTPDYERCRRNNPTADTPSRFPREIHLVETPQDVSHALKRATELGVKVGIRTSGHIFNVPGLIEGGILIDTVNLNRQIDYDPITQEVTFGPSCRVEELAARLQEVKRFFPHGHAPTVGSGGFLLAGGQGWFVRGWGATNQTWITKLEIVVPDGHTVVASRTENRDLFWAARGSGLGFFGLINSDNYMTLMSWAIERGRDTPKYGTDLNLTIDYPEKFDPAYTTDAIPPNAKLHMTLNLQCYCDTLREARTLLSAYDKLTPEVQEHLLKFEPVQRRTFDEIFARKRGFLGNAKNDRWQINSIMNDPEVPLERLLEAIKPAMLELPTRTSSVFMCHCDIVPDEEDACLSLPQDLYISTITGWTDPKLEPGIYQPMRDRYKRAFPVAVGQYITEIDVNNDDANCKVLSDTALAKFLRVREKWDPNELFPNYKAFVRAHDKINRLQNRSQL